MKGLLGILLIGGLFVAIQRLPEGENRQNPDIGLFEPYQDIGNEAGFRLLHRANLPHKAAVLFVPGHRGHANQGLPLAEYLYEVDVYVTDFNEAPTALSTALLTLEAAFIRECLLLLIEQYHGNVAIVGHSMGGVAASLALMDLNPHIQLFLALSSPIEQHPLSTSLACIPIYAQIHAYWKHSPIHYFSLSGGIRDLLIPAPLASLSELPGQMVYTSQLDGGLAADHIAVLWAPRVLSVLRNMIYEYLLGAVHVQPQALQLALFTAEVDCQLGNWPLDSRENTITEGIWRESGLYEYRGEEMEVVAIGKSVELLRKRTSGMAEICAGQMVSLGSEPISVFALRSFDLIRAYDSVFLQRINTIQANPSFLSIFFSSQTYESEYRGTKISINSVFSSRFPAKIHLSSASFLLVRCNSQYLLYPSITDTTLWLREDCTNALSLFIISEQDTLLSVTIGIDVWGAVLLRWVDLRIVLFTYGIAGTLLGDNRVVWMALVGVWVTGGLLRRLGFLMIDHIDAQYMTLGVLDLLFIGAITKLFTAIIALLCRIFIAIQSRIGNYIPSLSFSRKFVLISGFVSILFPWSTVFSLIIVSFHCNHTNQRAFLQVCCAHLLLDLPQLLAWSLYYLPPWYLFDFSLCFSLFCLHISLYSLLFSRQSDPISGYQQVAGLYISLCCYDLLYRVSTALTICEVATWLSVLYRPKVSLS